jgi:tetratricopeptide (TPR) repeat protein
MTKPSLSLLVLPGLLACGIAAQSQSTPPSTGVGPTRCAISLGNGKYRDVPCPNANPGSGPRYTPRVPPKDKTPLGPSVAERNYQQARALNHLGLAAYKNGDWANAASYFRQALALAPGNAAFVRNVALAENMIGIAAFNNHDWRTAIAHYTEALRYSPADRVIGQNLALAQKNTQEEQQDVEGANAIAAITSTVNERSGITKSQAQQDVEGAGKIAAITSALEQASSTSKSGNAAQAQTSGQTAKILVDCGFADKPCATPDHIKVRHSPQTPETMALLAHIPEAGQNNKRIMQDVYFYENYERTAIEKTSTLADVQRQLDSGTGNAAALTAEKSDLVREIGDAKLLQNMEEDDIKKQLLHDHLAWMETPAQKQGSKR